MKTDVQIAQESKMVPINNMHLSLELKKMMLSIMVNIKQRYHQELLKI